MICAYCNHEIKRLTTIRGKQYRLCRGCRYKVLLNQRPIPRAVEETEEPA